MRCSFSLLVPVCFFVSAASFAQEGGGGALPAVNDAAHPCITAQQYAAIDRRVAENIKLLKPDAGRQRTTATSFSWPLRTAAGLADCSYYYIGNYVDEDPTSPGIRDYNCGAVTYDGHRGTDICSAPYPFLKMDNNQVEAIAAAAGTIIDKQDGHFDKNCAMNSDTANYIIIEHADGSCALYWHFKKSSLTSKVIGASVAAGEFLGVVGSSGSSTAPHLHFEVWATTASASLRDPWAGSCNSLGGVTWWAAQKPYTEPAVLKAQVNMIPVVLPGCDTTETPNEDSCFAPGSTAKFYFFLRNETPGDTVHERIVNPGGTTFTSWTHNSNTSYLASYWYFNKVLPTTAGVYTYETIYNGITCSKNFLVSCALLGVPAVSGPADISIVPNPVNNDAQVTMVGIENGSYKLVLKNTIGQQVLEVQQIVEHNVFQQTVSFASLPAGMYFLSVESDRMRVVKKVIRQ